MSPATGIFSAWGVPVNVGNLPGHGICKARIRRSHGAEPAGVLKRFGGRFPLKENHAVITERLPQLILLITLKEIIGVIENLLGIIHSADVHQTTE